MAHEWIECKLADACSSIDYGLTASATDIEMGPRFLRITDIASGHIDWNTVPHVAADEATIVKYRLHDGDIVLARTGASTGVSAYIKHPPPAAVFASYLVRLQVKPEFDARYLSYYLKSDTFWTFIRGVLGDKSAQPNASASTMTQAPLRAPIDRDEQRAIAYILGTLDDKIELNRRMNKTLEAMARALFQSWFVDFDPVHAKLEGRQPIGLDGGTAALFPDSFQDSPLGAMPQGWAVESVGKVVDCVGGGTPSTAESKYWKDGTYHWATPKDFSSLEAPILLDTDRKLTDVGIAKISSGLLPAGTLLMSSRAPVGYLAITAIPVAINQGFIAMKCNERALNYFILNWCQANMAEIEGRATGTTFAEISKKNFWPIPILLPPEEIMMAFTEKVAPLYATITANLLQSCTLATVRDMLLPMLLSGEISVIDTARTVRDAA